MYHYDPKMKDCIQLCWECRTECQETFTHHCLEMGGEHVAQAHAIVMLDCIQACQTAADFMTRGSSLHAAECAACAEVCEACAQSCEQVGGEMMMKCAELCRRCAQSCREMSRSMEPAE